MGAPCTVVDLDWYSIAEPHWDMREIWEKTVRGLGPNSSLVGWLFSIQVPLADVELPVVDAEVEDVDGTGSADTVGSHGATHHRMSRIHKAVFAGLEFGHCHLIETGANSLCFERNHRFLVAARGRA
jgi:hypothetical protein